MNPFSFNPRILTIYLFDSVSRSMGQLISIEVIYHISTPPLDPKPINASPP